VPPPKQFESNRRKLFRRLVFFGILIAVVVGAALWISSNSEPEYQGVALSKWLQLYTDNVDADPQRQEAAAAIRHIGNNAIPVALRWLRASDSKWKIKLIELAQSHSFGKFDPPMAYEYHERAFKVMILLGPEAKSAIPALGKLLNSTNTAEDAAAVLCLFSKDALPTLCEGLTNNDPEIRRQTVRAIDTRTLCIQPANAGPVDPIILPDDLLSKLRKDTDPQVQRFAIDIYWDTYTSTGAADAWKRFQEANKINTETK